MTTRYFGTVEDSVTGRPVRNAIVYVKDSDGSFVTIFSDNGVTEVDQSIDPLTTDSTGFYSFWTSDTTVTLEYYYGGEVKRSIADVSIGGDVTEIANSVGVLNVMTGLTAPTVKSANYTASSGDVIEADTENAAWTLTLPQSGGTVIVRDYTRSWDDNNLTVNGNGADIDGDSTFICDASGYQLTFMRLGGASVWSYIVNTIEG